MLRRFEPHTQISVDISTKPNRVEFLRTIARQLLTDYWLTIDTEALYCAEAASASELLKLAELVHGAYQVCLCGTAVGASCKLLSRFPNVRN